MTSKFPQVLFAAFVLACPLRAAQSSIPFDAAPFGRPIPDGGGILWDDPREIHEVIVDFASPIPAGFHPRLEYWGSHWPQQHLPKDREPGGGDVGWLELGNWFNGGWRVADANQSISGNSIHFTFNPINAREFPDLKDYASAGRFTLKIRVAADQPFPKISRIQALTDSSLVPRAVRLAWQRPNARGFGIALFNGRMVDTSSTRAAATTLLLQVVTNSDPNTFDRTLVTIHTDASTFTFKVDDLDHGPLFLPEFGAAILAADDKRSYFQVSNDVSSARQKTLYDQISDRPEQTWDAAWNGMPPKKSRICFILGLDGGREKFRLDANGGVFIRWNDQFMRSLPARDTPRLDQEKQPVHFRFGLPDQPIERHTEDDSLPTCITTWQRDGLNIVQTAFATPLVGTTSAGPPPAPDVCAVAMLRFDFSNTTATAQTAELPLTIQGGERYDHLRIDAQGLIWNGNQLRGQFVADPLPVASSNQVVWKSPLAPSETKSVVVKMPFLPLTESAESAALVMLDFDRERKSIGDYWRAVLDKSARLITPEPVLNDFYRAVPAHLLINSEFDLAGDRRFARVGSMNYGNYGNESCMMVLDLDRRGYHHEAEECLEAWLHYQGTVGLPGDFDTKDGVLYGVAGYESGGYNQHHGWILWTLSEHYRFTRDDPWLRRAAPGIVAASDWIIREAARTVGQHDLGQGLLPPGDLEDIGDWWSWLSTSCYTWRGLDGAAWALEQIHHPEAARIRLAAEAYHKTLLENFRAASARSPVVRLRDGTAVPQIPSYVQRRGRSFGWICQTLEGAIHLIITGAIDPNSLQAQWILKDYEDNLFLSNQYGYTLDDFDKYWFGRGGMSMQACLLLDVEAFLYRDDVKQALRAMFNAIALNHFPDVHMNTEHALPEMGDWRGDHYKTSDEANACGWLRDLFIREQGDSLLIGQAVPRDWLQPAQQCGIENAATAFGNASILYHGGSGAITADLHCPLRNPPRQIRLRFRIPDEKKFAAVTVNGKPWTAVDRDWVLLPGNIGAATVVARY